MKTEHMSSVLNDSNWKIRGILPSRTTWLETGGTDKCRCHHCDKHHLLRGAGYSLFPWSLQRSLQGCSVVTYDFHWGARPPPGTSSSQPCALCSNLQGCFSGSFLTRGKLEGRTFCFPLHLLAKLVPGIRWIVFGGLGMDRFRVRHFVKEWLKFRAVQW